MALGIFKHWSLANLQTLKSDAETQLLNGKNRITTSSGVGSATTTKDWILTSKEFWDELNYALELKDPTTYAPRPNKTTLDYSMS